MTLLSVAMTTLIQEFTSAVAVPNLSVNVQYKLNPKSKFVRQFELATDKEGGNIKKI
jgi:hypothetical protein